MMSKRIVTAVLLVGALAATPALAQNARSRGERDGGRDGGGRDGGNRGGDARRGDRDGQRAAPRSPNRGGYERSRDNDDRGRESRRYDARPESRRDDSRGYQGRRGDNDRRVYSNDRRGYDNDRRVYNSRPYAYQYRAVPRPRYYNPGYRPGYYSPSRGYYRPYGYYGPRYVHPRIVTVIPYRPYYYRPRFGISVYYGSGGLYPYGYTPSGYYDPTPGRIYGGVRITDAPRDAQVFADGYYVGIVDDFDGVFQHVNLEAGEHRLEIRAPGLEPIEFDVVVQPGRTITLRADAYGY
jgi:hypothetical protein